MNTVQPLLAYQTAPRLLFNARPLHDVQPNDIQITLTRAIGTSRDSEFGKTPLDLFDAPMPKITVFYRNDSASGADAKPWRKVLSSAKSPAGTPFRKAFSKCGSGFCHLRRRRWYRNVLVFGLDRGRHAGIITPLNNVTSKEPPDVNASGLSGDDRFDEDHGVFSRGARLFRHHRTGALANRTESLLPRNFTIGGKVKGSCFQQKSGQILAHGLTF